MTREEFELIVKKFNEDKIKYNWINIINRFYHFTKIVFEREIKPFPIYYTFVSPMEFKFWILHSEEEDFVSRRFCPICGAFITKITKNWWFYSRGCCPEHAKQVSLINGQKTNQEKYGGKSPMASKATREKMMTSWKNKSKEEKTDIRRRIKQTKLERYGNEEYNNREKAEQTCLERYGAKTVGTAGTITRKKLEENNLQKFGCVSPFGNKEIKEKVKETNLERYGVEYIGAAEEVKEKIQNTITTKYGGMGSSSKQIKEKIEKTNLEKYGTISPAQNDKVKEKINKTNLEKYGVKYPLQNSDIHKKTIETGNIKNSYKKAAIVRNNWPQERKDMQAKRTYETKRKNGTFNTSKSFEDILIDYLIETYPQYTILTQYHDDPRYPFNCDCYVKELDLFIEFQGSYFHNWRPFNNSEAHIKEYNDMVEKGGQLKTITDVWRYKDVEKRRIAKENNLNYLEYWEYLKLLSEDINNNQNNLVLYYQQESFYRDAKVELYDPIKRWHYYQNAVKYSDFYKTHGYVSHLALLRRPYISRQIGFSSFNIKLCEMIDKKYRVYDPCGGWGHRLLGFKDHTQYIYNDINCKVENNCVKMANDLNITNIKFYNQDATESIQDEYDVVFTCPPYFGKEIYSDKGAENYGEEEFIKWWNTVLDNLHPTTGDIYIVINSNYLKYFTSNNYKYEIVVNKLRESHLHKDVKKAEEIVVKYHKVS